MEKEILESEMVTELMRKLGIDTNTNENEKERK